MKPEMVFGINSGLEHLLNWQLSPLNSILLAEYDFPDCFQPLDKIFPCVRVLL